MGLARFMWAWSEHRTRRLKILEFAVDPRKEAGICGEPATLSLEPLDYGLGYDLPGLSKSRVCKGLALEDGRCDPIHFYWNHLTQQLNWWRN